MASQRTNIATNNSSSSTATSLLPSNNNSNGYRPTTNTTQTLSAQLSPTTNNTHNSNAQTFNPRLILSQIISLQSFHYVILGIIFQINHILFGTSITIDRIFTSKHLDIWSAVGWIDNSAVLFSSLIGSLLLAIIVEKSKKCLDFSVTLFLIHIVLSSIYGGFPLTWDWWIIHILGMIMMVLFGEYTCSKRELSDIPLLVI